MLPSLMVMIISPLTWWPNLVCHYKPQFHQKKRR